MRTPVRQRDLGLRLPRRAAAFVLALAAGWACASPGSEFLARVSAARWDSGADPQRALLTLQVLRGELPAPHSLDLRLAVDEAECRVLTDLDAARALAVAEAGLAQAGPAPDASARAAWLRLRACRAGMLVETGQLQAAKDEFEALLAATTQPGDGGIHGLALLERGVQRSRAGAWDQAQQDLLAACEQLKGEGPARDHELCLGHLANHYQRVGDAEEALRLLRTLRAGARDRGATFDRAVYGYSIGQALQEQALWQESIAALQEAAQDSRRLGDANGVAYAEHAMAHSLLKLGRAQEALAQAESALTRGDPQTDPRLHELVQGTHARALVALGRAAQANALLDRIERSVRQRNELPRLQSWLEIRAGAMSQLGRWREAYRALDEARLIAEKLQGQRMSQQSARLRMQFNRERDAEELSTLRQVNAQGQRLRQTQAVALVLFLVLLLAAIVVAVRKFRQAGHLQNLASTDELTRLANRRALMAFADDAAAQARRSGQALAMLMIDIDHFKRINDSQGHAVGDQVLRHVAGVLAATLRDRDRLGRVGGEEFVAVLPGASVDHAQQVAERMRRAVDTTVLPGPAGDLRFTVSIGVASARSGETTGALLARADAAMYRAKHSGRNAVVVDPDDMAAPTATA